MSWIKCSERLPEMERLVLATPAGIIPIVLKRHHTKGGGWCWMCPISYSRYKQGSVSRWHPLPDPPKDGE